MEAKLLPAAVTADPMVAARAEAARARGVATVAAATVVVVEVAAAVVVAVVRAARAVIGAAPAKQSSWRASRRTPKS